MSLGRLTKGACSSSDVLRLLANIAGFLIVAVLALGLALIGCGCICLLLALGLSALELHDMPREDPVAAMDRLLLKVDDSLKRLETASHDGLRG